jgi:NADH-quinone oxidoreductase subunit H
MSIPQEILSGTVRVLLYLVGLITFAAFNAAYGTLIERWLASWFQLRMGPKEVGPFGLIQPIADGVKLLGKQLLVLKGADGLLFKLAPVLVITAPIACLAVIPFGETLCARNINVGLLAVVAFSSMHIMGAMLGGLASNNKFSSMGAARVVAQNIAYEIPMLLVIVALAMVTHTFNLHEIVEQQAGAFWHWNILRLGASPLMPVAFLIFFTCMLAECNRAPFDMFEAESELVAGIFTEYSGMGFGLYFMAEYTNIVLGCSLATVLFFGGWHCPLGLLPGVHWFLIKMYALCFVVMWIRWTFPRVQFYNLLNLSWKLLIPAAFIHLVLTAVMLKLV